MFDQRPLAMPIDRHRPLWNMVSQRPGVVALCGIAAIL
jgi:hypothetical protein